MTEVLKPQPAPAVAAAIQRYVDTITRLSQEARARLRVEPDIPYGPHERQKLDVYMPKETTPSTLPVLLFMHGGAWCQGTKEWMGFMAPAITCLPAIFISVGYRLAPESKYPDPEEDCRNALKWVYDNISGYGGDPNRLFVGGHSAGGHLAAMLALLLEALKERGLPENTIKGCFAMAGVFDLSTSRPELAESLLPSMDLVPKASPVNHVTGNQVPFHIAIGENDNATLIPQASQMAEALRAQGSPVGFLEMKGCDHFEMNIRGGDIEGEWATTVRQWMDNPPQAAP